jgi:pimeloyl-ACP methyl ester carboxylesterase
MDFFPFGEADRVLPAIPARPAVACRYPPKTTGAGPMRITTTQVVRRRGAAAVLCVAWLLLAAAPSRLATAQPLFSDSGAAGSPREQAEAHLERAEQFRKDAVDLYKDGDPLAIDAFYLACREAWDAIWTCPGSADLLAEAGEEYARSLEGLIAAARRHGRIDGCHGLVVGSKWDPVNVPLVIRGHPLPAEQVIDVVSISPPGDSRVSRCHQRWGFGVPVVLRTVDEPPETTETPLDSIDPLEADAALDHDFLPPRQSLSATAVLRFAMPGEPAFPEKLVGPAHVTPPAAVLDLVNPVEVARVRIGPWRPPVAADLTSPLLDMLEGVPKRSNVQGFLQPFRRTTSLPRLEMLEPYVPGKIPVIFIHGLASDEGTWFEMLNELRTWPAFHRCFTPWVFHYPTGAPFLPASSQLRKQLGRLIRQLDPSGTNAALRQIVLVGHSMGGLHTKMMAVHSGNRFWDAVCTKPFDQVAMSGKLRERMRESFFFEPIPQVRRVVFIATPHGGSSWATRAVGKLASAAVQQPEQIRAVHDELISANPPGTFYPYFEERLPTTIDTLEPDSPLLAALRSLPVAAGVVSHTIVGTGHLTDGLEDGDGVVSVPSARASGVVSERFVPATHTTVHHRPETVEEIVAILSAHAADAGFTDIPAMASLPQAPAEETAEGQWRPKRR